MIEHVPVLLVVAPIVGGALPLLAGLLSDRAGWSLATLTLGVHAVLAAWLVATVAGGQPVVYEVGGFAAPYGIELVVDGPPRPSWGLSPWSPSACSRTHAALAPTPTASTASTCCFVAGLTGMSITGDVFNLYVFLEITGLAAYALVASGDRDIRRRRGAEVPDRRDRRRLAVPARRRLSPRRHWDAQHGRPRDEDSPGRRRLHVDSDTRRLRADDRRTRGEGGAVPRSRGSPTRTPTRLTR